MLLALQNAGEMSSRPSFSGGKSFSIPRVTIPMPASIPSSTGGSERRRRKQHSSSSTPRHAKPVKQPKPKKKKKRKRMSDSENSDDSDDDSDPDYTL